MASRYEALFGEPAIATSDDWGGPYLVAAFFYDRSIDDGPTTEGFPYVQASMALRTSSSIHPPLRCWFVVAAESTRVEVAKVLIAIQAPGSEPEAYWGADLPVEPGKQSRTGCEIILERPIAGEYFALAWINGRFATKVRLWVFPIDQNTSQHSSKPQFEA